MCIRDSHIRGLVIRLSGALQLFVLGLLRLHLLGHIFQLLALCRNFHLCAHKAHRQVYAQKKQAQLYGKAGKRAPLLARVHVYHFPSVPVPWRREQSKHTAPCCYSELYLSLIHI